MHYPRSLTLEPSNKQRAPTQEPEISKVKRVASLVSWPFPVLAARAGVFLVSGRSASCLLPLFLAAAVVVPGSFVCFFSVMSETDRGTDPRTGKLQSGNPSGDA